MATSGVFFLESYNRQTFADLVFARNSCRTIIPFHSQYPPRPALSSSAAPREAGPRRRWNDFWMLLWICDAAQSTFGRAETFLLFRCQQTHAMDAGRPRARLSCRFRDSTRGRTSQPGSILLPTNARLRGMIPILRLTGSLKLHDPVAKRQTRCALPQCGSLRVDMRVLVFGASGMLGRDLLAAFSEDDATD